MYTRLIMGPMDVDRTNSITPRNLTRLRHVTAQIDARAARDRYLRRSSPGSIESRRVDPYNWDELETLADYVVLS